MKASLLYRIADKVVDYIFAAEGSGPEYIYDPNHEQHPGGDYHKTPAGWSKKDEKEEWDSSGLNDKQKKLEEKAKSTDVAKRISVAGNKNTHPETLVKLAKDNEEEVRKAVAGNKNTPAEILDKLATEDKSEEVQKIVLQNPNVSPETLDKFVTSENPDIQMILAQSKNTSIKALKQIVKDSKEAGNNVLWSVAIKNLNKKLKEKNKKDQELMTDEQKYLDKKSKSKKLWTRYEVAKDENTHASTLENLSEDESATVRKAVAKNKNTPAEILSKLAEDKNDNVREGVARNTNTPVEILSKLAENENGSVLAYLATNKSCTSDILNKIADKLNGNQHAPSILHYILSNPNCPDNIYDKYIDTDSVSIKKQMLENPKCPLNVLEKFSTDKSQDVKYNVITNPNVTSEILEKMANTSDNTILNKIAQSEKASGNLLDKLSENEDSIIRKNVAKNIHTPPETLEKMFFKESGGTYDSDTIKLSILDNPNVSSEFIDKLAEDENEETRIHIVNNSKTSVETLKKLAKDEHYNVKEAILENEKCDADVLKALVESGNVKSHYYNMNIFERIASHANVTPEILDKLAEDKDDEVRKVVAQNSKTKTETLAKLANDKSEEVRLNVAINNNTMPELLDKLSKDKDLDVRSAVSEHENVTPEILDKLAGDENGIVRLNVAKNKKTKSETLDKLSGDDNVQVRMNVAQNKNTSVEALKKLAQDIDYNVKKSVIENENATAEVLDLVAKGNLNEILTEEILEHKNTSLNTLFNMSDSLAKEINENEEENSSKLGLLNKIEKVITSKLGDTDEKGWNEVNKFIDSKVNDFASEEDLESVARSNFVHPETLKKVLEKTGKESVKTAIARNSNATEDILLQLASDPSEKVRIEVARNPKTSSAILTKLADDKDEEIRKLIAQNKNTSQETLEKLSNDSSADVKMCVIENGATSMDILKKMTKDKNIGQKANLQIKRRKGEAIITDKDKEYVKQYYTSSGEFRTYDFLVNLYEFNSIRKETYAEHGIKSLNTTCPNIESKIHYFSGSGYKGSNAQKLALLAAYHFGFEKGDFRTNYKKEPPPDPKEVEEYARYIKVEQDVLRKAGLVTKDGKVRLFRNVGESLFRYHKEDDPIQYDTYTQHYGATMEYRGSHIECWTFKPDLNWGGAKIYAEVPIEAVIGSFIGRGGTGDSYHFNNECECTICTTDFVKEVTLVGSGYHCIPEAKNGYLNDVKSHYGSSADDYEMFVMPVSEEDKQEFEKLYNSENPEERKEALNNPLMSKELITKMAEKEKDVSVLSAIAGNSKTPVDVLKSLIPNDDLEIQKELLANPNFPTPELENVLKNTKHDEIKKIVNEKLEEKKKKELEEIKNGSTSTKQSIAANPNTTLDVLKMLSEDSSSYVQKSVADNPNCPADILDKLSETGNEHIYKAISENPNVSEKTLLKIVDKSSDSKVKNAIVQNEHTPASVLKKLSEKTNDYELTKAMASHKNADEELLGKLIQKTSNPNIVKLCINNDKATPKTLELAYNNLKELDDSDALIPVAKHPKTPANILNEIYSSNSNDSDLVSALLQNENVTDEIAIGAAKQNNSMYDAYLLSNVNTSHDALDTIVKNKMNTEGQSYILKKISGHPNCSTTTMKEMLKYNLDDDSKRIIQENLNGKLKAIGNAISDEEPTAQDIQELREHFPESCKGKSMQELIILFKTLAKRGFFSGKGKVAPVEETTEPEEDDDEKEINNTVDWIMNNLGLKDDSNEEENPEDNEDDEENQGVMDYLSKF